MHKYFFNFKGLLNISWRLALVVPDFFSLHLSPHFICPHPLDQPVSSFPHSSFSPYQNGVPAFPCTCILSHSLCPSSPNFLLPQTSPQFPTVALSIMFLISLHQILKQNVPAFISTSPDSKECREMWFHICFCLFIAKTKNIFIAFLSVVLFTECYLICYIPARYILILKIQV